MLALEEFEEICVLLPVKTHLFCSVHYQLHWDAASKLKNLSVSSLLLCVCLSACIILFIWGHLVVDFPGAPHIWHFDT